MRSQVGGLKSYGTTPSTRPCHVRSVGGLRASWTTAATSRPRATTLTSLLAALALGIARLSRRRRRRGSRTSDAHAYRVAPVAASGPRSQALDHPPCRRHPDHRPRGRVLPEGRLPERALAVVDVVRHPAVPLPRPARRGVPHLRRRRARVLGRPAQE